MKVGKGMMGQTTFHHSGHARLLLVAGTNTMTKSNVGRTDGFALPFQVPVH